MAVRPVVGSYVTGDGRRGTKTSCFEASVVVVSPVPGVLVPWALAATGVTETPFPVCASDIASSSNVVGSCVAAEPPVAFGASCMASSPSTTIGIFCAVAPSSTAIGIPCLSGEPSDCAERPCALASDWPVMVPVVTSCVFML